MVSKGGIFLTRSYKTPIKTLCTIKPYKTLGLLGIFLTHSHCIFFTRFVIRRRLRVAAKRIQETRWLWGLRFGMVWGGCFVWIHWFGMDFLMVFPLSPPFFLFLGVVFLLDLVWVDVMLNLRKSVLLAFCRSLEKATTKHGTDNTSPITSHPKEDIWNWVPNL